MGKIHQLHAAVAASYGMFLFGLLYVWPSYTASLYTDKNTTLLSAPMNQRDVPLIGSVPSLGGMVGAIFCGKIINLAGRHKGGLILILPVLVHWTMIYFTTSSVVIITARLIGGFSCGAAFIFGPTFISEVAEESIRGFLASGPILFYCTGALMSYILGWFLTYKSIIWANLIFCCIGVVIIMLVTESPVWLLRQKREADSRLAFAHYRGVSPDSKIVRDLISRFKAQIIPIEMASMNDANSNADEAEKENLKRDTESIEKKETTSAFKLLFTIPSSRRAFIVTGLTMVSQLMMGVIAVMVYAKDIFTAAAPNLSPHLCSILLATTLLIGTFTSAVFTDKFGRRLLLVVSSVMVVLCLISMGLLMQNNVLPPWVTALVILIYCFALKLGASNIPYVLLAEVFLPEVQGVAAMILVESVWLLSFVQIAIFPYMVKYVGVHGAFYCFAIFGMLNAFVGIFLLPETKGLTNEQIQKAFLRRRNT